MAKWLFLPFPSGKPWTGATLYTEPLGGSESAVAYTALELARLGEEVTVCTHGTQKPTQLEGVQYLPSDQAAFRPLLEVEWDMIVSSRWPDILSWPWQGWKCLWFHDMPHSIPNAAVNRLIFISEYQREAWRQPDEISTVIGNGVDLTIFDQAGTPERDPNKILWTSNPDRGLPIACKIFQEVRKRWPDFELHVYGRAAVYGWDASVEAPYMPLPADMENVFLHEPLTKRSLARELKTAWAWFYPTYWPETYCIAALEAQAAGTPIISVPFGALPETVEGGILSYDILNAFSQLRNKRRWAKLSEAGIEHASSRSWALRAEEWMKLCQTLTP